MDDKLYKIIHSKVLDEMERIARLHNKTLAPLCDDLPLVASGLDSLCIAVLVTSLDDELEKGPFSGDEDMPPPVTIGDLVKLYEAASA